MAVDTPVADDLPLAPPDAVPAPPSIAEQQRQHAAEQPPAASDDSLPIAPPSILGTSFRDNRSGALWGDFGRGVGLGTRDVIEGAASLPLTALDAMTWPLGRVPLRAAGFDVTAPSDLVSKGLDAMGLPIAQTDAEKRRSEIIRGGAAMLTPMGVGTAAPKIVPPALRALFPEVTSVPAAAGQVVAGGVGAGTGDILANSDLVPPALKPTARLVGNIAGGGLTGMLLRSAGTLTNAMRGVPSEISEALERLGIKPTTVGAVSTSPSAQSAEAAFTRAPIASDIVQPAQRTMVNKFGDTVERMADDLSTSTPPTKTAAQAGNRVQDYIRDWRYNTFPQMEDNAWAPVNAKMQPAGDVVDPSGYRAALQRAASDVRLSNMPETQKAFASSKIQGWLDALDADAPPGTKLGWNAAHAIQQRIGDAMGTPDLVGNIGSKTLDSLYGGLANDRKIAAVLSGAGNEFDAANAFSTAGRTFINKTLSKAISGPNALKEDISGDQAAKNLLNGDATDLRALRLLIPNAADELASYHLRTNAQARPGQLLDTDSPSTGTFLTNYWKAVQRNPEGVDALYNTPQAQQKLSDLVKVAAQLRQVEKNANVSGTAPAAFWLSVPGQIAAGYAAHGIPGAIGLPAATLGGSALAGKGLTSPAAIAFAGAQRGTPLPFSARMGGLLGDLSYSPQRGP